MNSSSCNSYDLSSIVYLTSSSTAATRSMVAITLGLIINYINGTLVHTFRKHQIFYMNPRYILYIHLVLNDMIMLTTSIILLIFSFVFYNIKPTICLLIIVVAVFTTQNNPLNLAVMAVECYIAVCFPLQHAELCTIKRTYILIGCIWILSSLTIVPDIFLHLATDPLWLFCSIAFCDMEVLFRHPLSPKIRNTIYILYLTVIWLTLFITYFKVFFAARKARSSDGKAKKARNTILLHGFQLLLCMLTYVDFILKRTFISTPEILSYFHYFWYIFIHVLPRFVSPIVYGLRDKTFRQYFKNHLLCDIRAGNKLYPSK